MSDFDEMQEARSLDGKHEPSDQPAAEAGNPTTQPDAGREKARRSLEEELAPEFSRTLAPVPIPSPDPLAAATRSKEMAGMWDHYSRYELWQMYATANDAALTRGTEIDSLNRQLAGQGEASKGNLKKTCDEFTEKLAKQESECNSKLTGQVQRVQKDFADQRRTLQDEHVKALSLAQERADNKIDIAQQEAAQARAAQQETRKVWMRVSAGLAAAALFFGSVVYFQHVRYAEVLQTGEQAQATVARLRGDLIRAPSQLSDSPNQAGTSASTTPVADQTQPYMAQENPPIIAEYDNAASVLRELHVELPALYEQMPEFQSYSHALASFNQALGSVPESRRTDFIRLAAAYATPKVPSYLIWRDPPQPTVCAARPVELAKSVRALAIAPDPQDATRTNLQAEAERLNACIPAILAPISFERSHPEVNWDAQRSVAQAR